MVAADGSVVELQQHSAISPEVVAEREAFYGPGMTWLFNATEAYAQGRIDVRSSTGGGVRFTWQHPRRSVGAAKTRVLLDLGGGKLLYVHDMASRGYAVRADVFRAWMRDGAGLPDWSRMQAEEEQRLEAIRAREEADHAAMQRRLSAMAAAAWARGATRSARRDLPQRKPDSAYDVWLMKLACRDFSELGEAACRVRTGGGSADDVATVEEAWSARTRRQAQIQRLQGRVADRHGAGPSTGGD